MDAAREVASPSAQILQAADSRAQALAKARTEASAERVRDAEAASARRADAIAHAREAAAQATGATTRVSIARAETAPIFLYQAIDVETGEVVLRWPMQAFTDYLHDLSSGLESRPGGLLFDGEA